MNAGVAQASEPRANDLSPEESEARHRAILEAALDCVITIDQNGHVLEFNRAAEQTFGYSRTEALGRPIGDLIVPPRLRDAHRRGLERCVHTGATRILGTRTEFPALRSDGSEVPVELSVTRVDLPGPPLFTAYLRDISERLRADSELRRSQELDRVRARREQAERDFVTNAAHELRTPLAAITAALEVLQQGAKAIPEERDAFLADLDHETARLNRLMHALLELARVQATGEVPRVSPVRLEPMLTEIAETLPLQQAVQAHVDCDDGLFALAAPDILERALVNLGTNAAEHTANGRIVFVARRGECGDVELEVADTGCGIAPDDLDHVFDRFYRAGERGGDGFGLGLSIVRETVRVLGGTVCVESVPDVGTIVRLSLPAPANGRADGHAG